MMWLNRGDAALLARIIQHLKCNLQMQNRCSKYPKDNKLKMIYEEDIALFGKLIETKKEKLERIKLISEGKIPRAKPSKIDSEFSWAMNSSSKLSIFKFNQQKEAQAPQINRIIQTNSDSNCDTKTVPHNIEKNEILNNIECNKKASDNSENNIEKSHEEETTVEPTAKIETDNEQNTNKKIETNKKKIATLSDDIFRQLLQFPILETSKNLDNEEINKSNVNQVMSISSRENKSVSHYPSVTKVLSATMSENARALLERWKLRMIQKLGVKGFEIYQAELLGDGKLLHSAIQNKLLHKPHEVSNRIKESFSSLSRVFENIDEVKAAESHVVHSKLMYRGIVDCVAYYRGDLCLIDWKKSDKAKESISDTYDAPLQLASYIGALNADSKYPFQIKKGLVVVAYTNGNPARVHEVSKELLDSYWKLWLQRLQDYHVAVNPR